MGKPLGTLIVVVLKARNLPNKQRIGKQDPYATCTYLSHRKRTKTDKRGGQHPVWDDELRFEVYEHIKDVMPSTSVATTSTGGVAPVKSGDPALGMGGNPGVKELRVAVYADDPRDPELIGEGKVELTETLKKGEFDDWVTITNKGKYQGEVYLEMTFYSAKPPPDKQQASGTPVRAGVFEAGSPASGLRPAQAGHSKPSTPNGPKATSPAPYTPTKVDPWNIPLALRVGGGSTPKSPGPSGGNLPLPGERGPANPLSPRHRSSESLGGQHSALPIPHAYRSPSRNHSYDEATSLMNTMSISDQPSSHDTHTHQAGLSPFANPNAPFQASDHLGRPHRHSFSTYSSTSSPYPGQANLDRPLHNINRLPTPNGQTNADRFSSHAQLGFSQNATQSISRRPLPIPGADAANRPTSAWGEFGNRTAAKPPQTALVSPHHSGPGHVHSHYPPQANTDSFTDLSYPSNMEQIAFPSHVTHEEVPEDSTSGQQSLGTAYLSHQPYADQSSRPFHTPVSPSNMRHPSYQSAPLHYSLPPPPAGQAPVPIHEVYRAVTPRPLPPTSSDPPFRPQSPYQPPLAPYANSNQSQAHHLPPRPSSSNDMGYGGHEIYPSDPIQPSHAYSALPDPLLQQQQHYAPSVIGAPPPPPPHLQQQLQFPGYQSQPLHPVPHSQHYLPTPAPAPPGPHSRQPSPSPYHDPHNPYRVLTPAPRFSHHAPLPPPPPPQQQHALIYSPPRQMVPMPPEYPPVQY
ncbi:hypothetical protein CROQUDRAFT_676319 [Cronartium quercuum f. sp. fusiforme G11]|uniref:C2 domain-containing protein n=1 Tax=Cronartium quercuum f. sp. fusiforme G11 TaxID=708437 RepID=A0A9P6NP40_9BASI|nr:hypothetical protein CROQUDRAFT_676319 [Cronartium quercuum f. sp. fusiforme G11]